MKNLKTRKSDGGFTLLELMISLAILSFGILAVVGMYVFAIGGNAQGRHMSQATHLAAAKIEDLKVTPYANLPKVSTTTVDTSTYNFPYSITFWTVSSVYPGLGVKKAYVDVVWVSKEGSHTVSMNSLIAKQ